MDKRAEKEYMKLISKLNVGQTNSGPATTKGGRVITEEVYIRVVLNRIIDKTIVDGECWRYTGKKVGKGYGCITYKDTTIRLNRFIAYIFHGMNLEGTEQGNHTQDCKFKDCWRPEHIYVGTQKDNVRDQIETGNFHYGSDNLNKPSHHTLVMRSQEAIKESKD